MQEPREKIKELIFARVVNCKAVKVLIDSGTSKNYISSDLLNELGLIIFENRPIKILIANKATITSNEVVKIYLTLKGMDLRNFWDHMYLITFHIILFKK